jgi:hypothetical protein
MDTDSLFLLVRIRVDSWFNPEDLLTLAVHVDIVIGLTIVIIEGLKRHA